MIFNTWCPIFPGFYGTNFDTDNIEESEIYDINEARKDNGFTDEIDWDDCEFDYTAYYNRVSNEFCSIIENELKEKGYVTRLEMETLVSPREYNFENDSINVEVELSDENIKNIQNTINENLEAFKEYIKKRYTSRDGFISFFSNDPQDWLEMIMDFKKVDEGTHYLGSILEFICKIEEITEYEIMMTMVDNGELYLHADNYDTLTTKSLNEIRGIEELDDEGNVIDWEAERLENNRNSEGQMELFQGVNMRTFIIIETTNCERDEVNDFKQELENACWKFTESEVSYNSDEGNKHWPKIEKYNHEHEFHNDLLSTVDSNC